ncbi:hypothetical protein GCM10022288_13400 [Gryllotalpicola kribbensis]|jgi:glycosyltransferase involved in cell wall biosynthesis|uniref:Glycosyl transferase family 1 domain-containing protein n=1 Tax=Gryllotalpicola kribbensis TaxID=993084 RepID=A0ABP8AQR9_9MICO
MIITNELEARIVHLLEHWDAAPVRTDSSSIELLYTELDREPSLTRAWEALAVLRLTLPTRDDVYGFARAVKLNGAQVAVDALPSPVNWSPFGRTADVVIISRGVVADVHTTVHTKGTTGIQRVARETVSRWASLGLATPVAWSEEHLAPRLLSAEEAASLSGRSDGESSTNNEPITLVIPLGGTYVIPELTIEPWRNLRLSAIGQFASTSLTGIGFDTVPVTSTETAAAPIAERFPRYLDALGWADRVAAISEAAATEYRGWRRMLVGSGRMGPEIESIPLAAEVSQPGKSAHDRARSALDIKDQAPFVLVVGSHEPRKNHLAILYAAEVLWREGHDFQLAFIGGNAWGAEMFTREVARLKDSGHPISIVSGAGDDIVFGAYYHAAFSVFPSLNEGFGLPVVESLASGTPVITSAYGSMREIAEQYGGVVLVDPRNDQSLIEAMRTLLTDSALLESLTRQAQKVTPKTWDSYATEVFDYLTR